MQQTDHAQSSICAGCYKNTLMEGRDVRFDDCRVFGDFLDFASGCDPG